MRQAVDRLFFVCLNGKLRLRSVGVIRNIGDPLSALLCVVLLFKRKSDQQLRLAAFDGTYRPTLIGEQIPDCDEGDLRNLASAGWAKCGSSSAV